MKYFIVFILLFNYSFCQSEFTEEDYNLFRIELGIDTLSNVDKTVEMIISKDNNGNNVVANITKSDNESFRLIYDINENKFITLFRGSGYSESIYNIYIGSSVEECINKIKELNLRK